VSNLDFWRDFHGPWYGFDHIEHARMHADEHHVGGHYALWMEEKGYPNWRDYFRHWPIPEDEKDPKKLRRHLWEIPEEIHHTKWVGERTMANIEDASKSEEPFFIWSSFFDPHPQYLIPEPWASMYDPADMPVGELTEGEIEKMPSHYRRTQEKNPDYSEFYSEDEKYGCHGFHSHVVDEKLLRKDMAIYYGMISFIDQQVGEILNKLDELGIADNTIILFTTDHGHYLGQHGLIAKGAFNYDDLQRIPMIARYPGKIKPGSVCKALQSQVDFAPTFLSAAGIKVPGLMQGKNQMDVWQGKEDKARDNLIIENRHQPTLLHSRTYVDEQYKISVYRHTDEGELFDLKNDPEEKNNLWNDSGSAQLKSQLLLKLAQAELEREPTRMPRIASA
jgi:arylsulfatase A-like enzyme